MDVFLSRFAFIFLIYAVITSGYINEILSCQMQKLLTESKYFRHALGVLLIFVFIMLEGGWSFNDEINKKAENDWSSGNVIDTLQMAFAIYILFVISSKSKLMPNLVFFGLVLVIYFINTQRNYYKQRNMITEAQNDKLIALNKSLFVISLIVLVYGFIDYVGYQQKEYGVSFKWGTFLLGTSKCAKVA
jgi:hypothetical protein